MLVPSGLVASLLVMVTLAHFALALHPINLEAWRLTHDVEPVAVEAHVAVSFRAVVAGPQLGPAPPRSWAAAFRPAAASPPPPASRPPRSADAEERSRFCRGPRSSDGAGPPVRLGSGGQADRYAPLSGWELIALLRLAPIIGMFDAAVETYRVPAHLYLRILINESYLDPLAVGTTDDHGLSQQNGDSLTMLRALSRDDRDALHNPYLFAGPFSLYDPDFSACAGAAKLAWALRQPSALSDEHAYALYINPIDGVLGRRISERHRPLTAPMMELGGLVDRIEDAIAAFEREPDLLAKRDHDALRILASVRGGSITAETGFERAYEQVARYGLPDRDHYRRLLAELLEGRTVGER